MIFRSAVRRLTVVYTVIQLLLFTGFGLGIYFFVTGTFDVDTVSSDGAAAIGAVERGFAQLRFGLVVAFIGVCFVAPIISYAMARAALRPLRANYERQQRFVDDASHEFRSPLSVIRGELELALSRRRSTEEYRLAIATTLDAAQGLIQLSDDLLFLATDAPKELREQFTDIRLADVIATVVGMQPEHVRGRLSVHVDPGTLVRGSSSLLARAVANLIDNAAKYSPDGAITVASVIGSGKTTVSVRDTGPGMSPQTMRHARERFWRNDSTAMVPGQGLGLALVEQIVDVHHGRMTIESVLGSGSTVSITLPVVIV